MPDEPEMIRQQMEETRADLRAKLETLEQQVVNTVSGTTAAVAETVENVKEAVQDTVGAVKETVQDGMTSVRNAFNVSRQMDRHPWLFVAGSVAVGYCGGRLFEQQCCRSSSQGRRPEQEVYPEAMPRFGERAEATNESWAGAPAREAPPSREQEKRPGLIGTLFSEFSGELDKVKSLAVGAGLGLVRDFVSEKVAPSLRPKVTEVIDSVTLKLGGQVVDGPLFGREM